jgi:hypothetical protein
MDEVIFVFIAVFIFLAACVAAIPYFPTVAAVLN